MLSRHGDESYLIEHGPMEATQLGLMVLYLGLLGILALPLGRYIDRVMQPAAIGRRPHLLAPERWIYRACGVDAALEMDWITYAKAIVLFNACGTVALYGLQRVQRLLPLNAGHFAGVSVDSALNTAVSFATNTSWQGYVPESTMSYAVQMLGITVQSFLSGATGIAVLIALLRAFVRVSAKTLGNAWVDVTRASLYILLPLAVLFAVILVAQGAVQNFDDYESVVLLDHTGSSQRVISDGAARVASQARTQLLPMGPAASQTSIALLSGDGGGFFNANSAHPYANPTPLSNLLEMLAILLVPAALCVTFGIAVGDRRQGWAILATMGIAFLIAGAVAISAEHAANPDFAGAHVDQAAGNMEGKETRFGATDSALFATVTTSGGDGAVNSMHESYTPIGGLVPLALMQLGEVIFGGPGSGLYGMLVYAIMAVFIASLMIGRAPEYLGKSIEAYDMKMASIVVLTPAMLILAGSALSVTVPSGRAAIGNPGAHGLTEVLYALTSTANNNGSAFAALSSNVPFYNVVTAIAMWLGRFIPLVAVLALGGSLTRKKRRAPGPGTLPTHGPMFVGLLLATIVAIGALTFVPPLALGPIAEQLSFDAPRF